MQHLNSLLMALGVWCPLILAAAGGVLQIWEE